MEKEPIHSLLKWEIVVLLSSYLDPRSLALASCVCRSWQHIMSSDSLWKPFLLSDHPSLSLAVKQQYPNSVSYRKLYGMAGVSKLRRTKPPCEPRLSLSDIIIVGTMTLKNNVGEKCCEILKNGNDIFVRETNLFLIDVEVKWDRRAPDFDKVEYAGVSLYVVLKNWKASFCLLEYDGRVNWTAGGGWVSEKLPQPGCCSYVDDYGIVAEISFTSIYEKISVGLMSASSWRYLCLNDGLRYLQHFLLC